MAQIRRRSNRIGYPIQRVTHRKTVTVAGNAELAQPADPARDLLALGIAFVEVVICGAENDAGDARPPREVAFHHDLGAEITADATSSASSRIRGRH